MHVNGFNASVIIYSNRIVVRRKMCTNQHDTTWIIVKAGLSGWDRVSRTHCKTMNERHIIMGCLRNERETEKLVRFFFHTEFSQFIIFRSFGRVNRCQRGSFLHTTQFHFMRHIRNLCHIRLRRPTAQSISLVFMGCCRNSCVCVVCVCEWPIINISALKFATDAGFSILLGPGPGSPADNRLFLTILLPVVLFGFLFFSVVVVVVVVGWPSSLFVGLPIILGVGNHRNNSYRSHGFLSLALSLWTANRLCAIILHREQ